MSAEEALKQGHLPLFTPEVHRRPPLTTVHKQQETSRPEKKSRKDKFYELNPGNHLMKNLYGTPNNDIQTVEDKIREIQAAKVGIGSLPDIPKKFKVKFIDRKVNDGVACLKIRIPGTMDEYYIRPLKGGGFW